VTNTAAAAAAAAAPRCRRPVKLFVIFHGCRYRCGVCKFGSNDPCPRLKSNLCVAGGVG